MTSSGVTRRVRMLIEQMVGYAALTHPTIQMRLSNSQSLRRSLNRHCERSEAIHFSACCGMDCFVAYAPRNDDLAGFKYQTARGQASAFSRREAPELCVDFALETTRGRREDRVRAAPAVPCAICTRNCAHEHTGSAENTRPSLRNGFTAYFALSPVTGLSCHRRP